MRSVILALVLLLSLSVCGCGHSAKDFEGTWKTDGVAPHTLVLRSDGTGHLSAQRSVPPADLVEIDLKYTTDGATMRGSRPSGDTLITGELTDKGLVIKADTRPQELENTLWEKDNKSTGALFKKS